MSIRWRIVFFSAGSILIILALLSFWGISATRDSTNQVLAERLVLAEQVAHNIDFNIEQSQRQLAEIGSSRLTNSDQAALSPTDFLKQIKPLLPFSAKYLFLTDNQGQVVTAEPPVPGLTGSNISGYAPIPLAQNSGRPLVTNVNYDKWINNYVAYITIPLADPNNRFYGTAIGAAIELSDISISNLINVNGVEKMGYADVVDSNGFILASSNPDDILKESDHGGVFASLIKNNQTAVSTCHSCHVNNTNQNPAREIITFAPLANAPWGVVIRQSETEALANTRLLQERLIIFGLVCLFIILPLIWLATRSITIPINRLTAASKKIAQGSLDEAVVPSGKDEIGVLAQTFDTMRVKLKDSLESLRQRTRELEGLNTENARLYDEVKEKEKVLSELLKHSISAQEEERKRIARELHDETSQALTTLSIGLATIAKSAPENKEQWQGALKKNQDLAIKILDEIHRLIFDLRPSVLDDLGLVPALKWYANYRLGPVGVKVNLETSGVEQRLPSHIEVTLFRIAQEAISNIALHAQAEFASICLDFGTDYIQLTVEDDGQGFKTDELLSSSGSIRGLGIRGMIERAEVIGGTINIKSRPDLGTQIEVKIPVTWSGVRGG